MSYIFDLFAALLELASASARTLLKLLSSVRALKTLWRHLKGNIIWTCSGGPVTSLSVAFISFAKREAIDFCQIFFSIIAGIVLIEFIKQKVGVTVLV